MISTDQITIILARKRSICGIISDKNWNMISTDQITLIFTRKMNQKRHKLPVLEGQDKLNDICGFPETGTK